MLTSAFIPVPLIGRSGFDANVAGTARRGRATAPGAGAAAARGAAVVSVRAAGRSPLGKVSDDGAGREPVTPTRSRLARLDGSIPPAGNVQEERAIGAFRERAPARCPAPPSLSCAGAASGKPSFCRAVTASPHWPRTARVRAQAAAHVASPSFARCPRPERRRDPLGSRPGRMADEAGPHRRPVRGRRNDRHPRPRPRPRARQGVRPGLHHREQGRRRRQPRRRHRRQVAARRLHAADGNRRHPGDQSFALSEDAVRRGQGLRADHARRRRSQRDRRCNPAKAAANGITDVRSFIAYARRNPGKAQHGVERQRHLDPSLRRALQDDDRHVHGPLPVPRLGSGAARPDRRDDGRDVRQPAVGAAADQGRQADRPRRDEQRAERRVARRADDRRGGPGERLRRDLVVRPARRRRGRRPTSSTDCSRNRPRRSARPRSRSGCCRRARCRAAWRRPTSAAIAAEAKKWAAVVKASGAKVD